MKFIEKPGSQRLHIVPETKSEKAWLKTRTEKSIHPNSKNSTMQVFRLWEKAHRIPNPSSQEQIDAKQIIQRANQLGHNIHLGELKFKVIGDYMHLVGLDISSKIIKHHQLKAKAECAQQFLEKYS